MSRPMGGECHSAACVLKSAGRGGVALPRLRPRSQLGSAVGSLVGLFTMRRATAAIDSNSSHGHSANAAGVHPSSAIMIRRTAYGPAATAHAAADQRDLR
jgi:hypothetical protein